MRGALSSAGVTDSLQSCERHVCAKNSARFKTEGKVTTPDSLLCALLHFPDGVVLAAKAGLQGPDAGLSSLHLKGVVCQLGCPHSTLQLIYLWRPSDHVR